MMGDTLFLQFYNQIKGSYFDLCNGFSDTHDLCTSKGDFFWIQHEVDSSRWYDEEIYANRKLPIDRGTIYISAIYLNHLYQSYVWAREYPDIQFVVGGPVAAERSCSDEAWNPVYFQLAHDMSLPDNLKITGMSVEDWFHVSNFSGEWKLMIPEDVGPTDPIYFSYTLDNRCYWSKCVYCNIALHAGEHFRQRKELHFEFENVTHPGTKIVRLNTGSLTPAHIRKLLPTLPRRDDRGGGRRRGPDRISSQDDPGARHRIPFRSDAQVCEKGFRQGRDIGFSGHLPRSQHPDKRECDAGLEQPG